MTCQHCCGANKLFNDKTARKDLKRYLKKGAKKQTQALIDAISKNDLSNLSLLDIGGGIGPIHYELLPKGVVKITDVDASEGYIVVAKSEAKKRKINDKISYLHGDFVDLHQEVEKHDIVTLDKVICCYPYMEDLVDYSSSKANIYYALVYPLDSGVMKFFRFLIRVVMSLKKNAFRMYVHSPEKVAARLTKNGFERIHYSRAFPWRVEVYKRTK